MALILCWEKADCCFFIICLSALSYLNIRPVVASILQHPMLLAKTSIKIQILMLFASPISTMSNFPALAMNFYALLLRIPSGFAFSSWSNHVNIYINSIESHYVYILDPSSIRSHRNHPPRPPLDRSPLSPIGSPWNPLVRFEALARQVVSTSKGLQVVSWGQLVLTKKNWWDKTNYCIGTRITRLDMGYM